MRIAAIVLPVALGCATPTPSPTVEPERETTPPPAAAPAPVVEPAPPVEVVHTTAWTCGRDRVVLTSRGEEAATLELGGSVRALRATPSASGVRLVGEGIAFQVDGEVASLERGGPAVTCVFDTATTTWLEARDRGVTFRALGQEPGWTLEIGPDRMVLVAQYGEMRVKTSLDEPSFNPRERTTTWRGKSTGHALTATVKERPCTDTMSGEAFDYSVTVTLDWQTWSGCGRKLR